MEEIVRIVILIKPIKREVIKNCVQTFYEEYIVNPYDLYSLNFILKIKQFCKASITCLVMGALNTENVLRQCIAAGCDNAVLVSDINFSGSDTIATANVLEAAIKKIGYDLIVAGEKSVDGETGQTKFALAELLNVACYCNVNQIKIEKNEIILTYDENGMIVENIVELPCMISLNNLAYSYETLNLKKIKEAYHKNIEVWNMKNLSLDIKKIGKRGSRTKVVGMRNVKSEVNSKTIHGDAYSIAKVLDQLLNKKELKV